MVEEGRGHRGLEMEQQLHRGLLLPEGTRSQQPVELLASTQRKAGR